MSKKKKSLLRALIMVVACTLMLSMSVAASAKTVAKIGSKKYTSIEKALAKVKNGQTIKLQCNVTLGKTLTVKRNVKFTLDLNKKKILFNTKLFDQYGIHIKKGNVTIKNGTIAGVAEYYDKTGAAEGISTKDYFLPKMYVEKAASLTITSGTYKVPFYSAGTVTVKGGTFKDSKISFATTGKLTVNGGKINKGIMCYYGSTLTVKKGTITNSADADAAIQVLEGYKKLTISGGTIKGTSTENAAVCIWGGKTSREKINTKYIKAKSGIKIGYAYYDDDGYMAYSQVVK